MARLDRILSSRWAADLLLWLVITAPLLIPDDDAAAAGLSAVPLLWVRIAAVPLLAFAVLVSRRAPVVAAAVPVALGLAATPELLSANFMVAHVLLAYLLGRRRAGRRAPMLLFTAACAVGLLLVPVIPGATMSDWFGLVTNVLVTLVLPWMAGRYARQHAELVSTGWELAERLEREQELAGDRVRLRERSRIARDMHDSLGHELSMIALRAAALQVAPDVGPRGRQAAAELRRAAAAATQRLRDVVGVLREDGESPSLVPADDTVRSLVNRAAAAGMPVILVGELSPPGSAPLTPMTDRAVYRVVQEALTNATKHAPGAKVTVTLHRDGADAVVSVVNEPPPAPPASPPQDGHGLLGLHERVRLAGGTLRTEPLDGGFAVTARLPRSAGAATTPPRGTGTSRRELALARRKVRRTVIDAIWVPVAAAAVLVLAFTLDTDDRYRSVLNQDVYQQLRLGDPLPSVAQYLPAYQVSGTRRPDGTPADPAGTDECRFYRVHPDTRSPAYRLCFTGGHLSHKDTVYLVD
ncbi:histidine kinase [Phytohabitans sp. ZYX-F-186]|uniref:histidine kinase n=1 Tax=Phytohabitans maris TaxID=3071409 RepID=A0ABU0ZMM2_9ACTN|nr:histidine kinase [Phytohabitans sp. ZYX-F-186]MDQ7908280.1 histidine kinase [Phytohabitans sp. ZYX-F-186]